MLLDAWFAPPVISRRNDISPPREDVTRPGPAPVLALSYRPSIRVPRFVCGLLPSGIGFPR